MTRFIQIAIAILLSVPVVAQERKAAFGFHAEPVLPSALFRITTDEVRVDDILFTTEPRPGFAFGAYLSVNISPKFLVESGINHMSRSYRISVKDDDFRETLDFRVVNFEMPLNLTYYVRLGPQLYMGHSAGFSFQFLPSNLRSIIDEKDTSGNRIFSLEQVSRRKYWMMPAFKGGIGLEYRTRDNGYFYIGPSYRLFTVLYWSQLFYNRGAVDIQNLEIKPIGDYFGITLRYVFPPTDLLIKEKNKKQQQPARHQRP